MYQPITKQHARNIVYGSTIFFSILFLGLTFVTLLKLEEPGSNILLTNSDAVARKIVLGEAIWEQHDCIGCHSLLGEGAYFAPELSRAYQRYDFSLEGIKRFINSRPVHGIEQRRSMPQFNLTEAELDALTEFLKYVSEIDTHGWPANKEG